MSLKDSIIDEVLRVEGGYVNDPADSGGETNYGITVAVARANGYTGPMKALPKKVAREIYAARYWHTVGADLLAKQSEAITREVVDTGVNAGPRRAAKFLQRALNLLNDRGTLWPDMAVDGVVGPTTAKALATCLRKRGGEGEIVLLRMLNAQQAEHYMRLGEKRQKDERFIFGWFLNRVVM